MNKPRGYHDHDDCILIEEGELKKLSPGMRYYMYQHKDGKIHCETLCATFDIADSIEEYKKIPEDELESTIYGCEMTIAR